MSQTKAQLISDLVQALNFTGTASAPANGLFLSATNTLALSTNSAERLKIDGTEIVFNDIGSNIDFRVESDTNTHALFLDAGNNRVGINTAAPNDELEVTGNVQVTSGNLKVTSSNPGIRFTDSDASGGFGHVGVNNTSGSLVLRSDDGNALSGSFMGFEIDGQPKMYLDADGRFLIGATSSVSPTAMLQTKRANNNTILISNSDATATNFTAVDFAPANNTIGSRIVSKAIGTFGSSASETADLFFETRHQGTSEKRLYIDSTGLIGIGTDSPSNIIHATGSNSGTGYQFINTHATDGFGVRIAGGGTTTDRYALRVDNAASEEKFRVNANGNVGIGTNTPTCPLQVDAGSSGSGTSTALELNHKGNDLNDAIKLNFARAGGDIGSIVLEKVNNNNTTDFIFNTRVSNTVSESMRITGAGHVGIGSTTPQNRLDVTSGSDTGLGLRVTGGASGGTNIAQFRTNNGTERMTINNDVTISTGNLVIGASDKGIDFSAGADSASTSNILDEYEEGEYTPALSNGQTLNTSYDRLRYTKIGRQVSITGQLVFSGYNSSNFSTTLTIGLPFNNGDGGDRSEYIFSAGIGYFNPSGTSSPSSGYQPIGFYAAANSSHVSVFAIDPNSDTTIGNWVGSGSDIWVNLTYFTD